MTKIFTDFLFHRLLFLPTYIFCRLFSSEIFFPIFLKISYFSLYLTIFSQWPPSIGTWEPSILLKMCVKRFCGEKNRIIVIINISLLTRFKVMAKSLACELWKPWKIEIRSNNPILSETESLTCLGQKNVCVVAKTWWLQGYFLIEATDGEPQKSQKWKSPWSTKRHFPIR